MGDPVLVNAPTVEPIDIIQAKKQLEINHDDDNVFINDLILTARMSLERYLNRALITQTWKVYFDCWQTEFSIPYPKLQSVASVKYYDGNGTLQTLTENDYYWVVTTSEPGKVVQKYSTTYPTLQLGRPAAIEITFTCGFGLASAVPAEIKHAMKVLITDYYEHRGSIVLGQVNKIPGHVRDLVHPHKIYQF